MSQKLELKLLLNAVDKVTAPLKKMRSAGNKTTEQLRKTQERVKMLNKQSSQIDGYRKISRSLGITSQQLKASQEKVKHLAQEMAQSKAPSKALTKEFEQARAVTVKLNTKAYVNAKAVKDYSTVTLQSTAFTPFVHTSS